MTRIGLVERRKKRAICSSTAVKFLLLFPIAILWALVTWSHYHIAQEQKHLNNPEDMIDNIMDKHKTLNRGATKPKKNLVDRTKEEKHPDPGAKLLSKTGTGSHGFSDKVDIAGSSTFPPLEKVVTGKYNVSGDLDFLIDFAIVGFPKCGTSTMMEYLDASPYTKVAQKERCELGTGRQAKLARDMYEELPEGNYKRGIKCPRDLENEYSLGQYTKYLPHVNYLVGLRHPVRWFESFYNFRVFNNNPMPPPEDLVGVCKKYSRHVCTHRARFHQHLANLGKTPLEGEELNFFKQHGQELRVHPVRGKVFLYHVEQLRVNDDQLRLLDLRKDLSSFLGLPEILPPMNIWRKPGKNLTAEQWANAMSIKLDICHSNHTEIRNFIIDQAKGTAEWILQYMLKSRDVYVSSPDYFKQLLKAWGEDPCKATDKV